MSSNNNRIKWYLFPLRWTNCILSPSNFGKIHMIRRTYSCSSLNSSKCDSCCAQKIQAVLNQNKLEVLKDNTWIVLLNLTPMPRILLISSQHLATLLSMSPNINKIFWPEASSPTSLGVSITLFLLGWKINRRYIHVTVCEFVLVVIKM